VAIKLGSIIVELLADTGKFVEGMTKASAEGRKTSKEIQESFEKMGSAAEGLLAPFGEIGAKIGEAFGGLGSSVKSAMTAMSGLTSSFGAAGAAAAGLGGACAALAVAGAGIAAFAANSASEFHEMSEKTGVSVEALSSLSYAAKQNGISTESMTKGLEKLNKSIFAAATAPAGAVNGFSRMGVALKDSQGHLRDTQDVLNDLATKFEAMPDGPAKGALAMQLFGRAGAEMLPLLNQGADGIKKLTTEASLFGITISGKTADQAHQFVQGLGKIQAALMGAANSVMKELLPSMQAFVDMLVNDLKDPAGYFRTIGEVIMTFLVPSFKVVASAVAIAMTAAKEFISVLTHGVDFGTQMVIGLGRAISDVAHGHFKEAGNELKAQFTEGLDIFTKGVAADVDKANSKLTDFFAKTWFGADAFAPEKKKDNSKNGEVDTHAADKSNPIAERIQKLQEAAQAEMKLAGTVDLSTSAIRMQNEQNEISKVLLELHQIAAKKHLQVTDEDTAAVKRAIVATNEFKAAFSIREEVEKLSLSMAQHIQNTGLLTEAYEKGGRAILDAEVAIAAAPLTEKVKELEASMQASKQTLGENSAEYLNLAAALQKAKTELAAYTQEVLKSKQVDATEQIARSTDALRTQLTALAITGAAIGGTTEEMRQAAVQAQLTSYALSHVGVDQNSEEWKRYATAVDEASKAAEQHSIKQQALKFDLQGNYDKAIAQLEQYRSVLQALGKDVSGIDAAETAEFQKLTKEQDALLLKTNSLGNGMKAFFNDYVNSASFAAQQIHDVMTQAFTGIQDNLAKFFTGQKTNWLQLGKNIEDTMAKAIIGDAMKSVTKSALSMFGLGELANGKPDGTANNPLHVKMASSSAAFGSGPADGASNPFTSFLSKLPLIGGLFGNHGSALAPDGSSTNPFFTTATGTNGLTGALTGGGGGGFLSGLTGMFSGGFSPLSLLGLIPGLAGGGDVTPGRAYVVGEQHPELFMPRSAGTIVPSVSGGDTRVVNMGGLHVHGVTDADSFKKNSSQVQAQMGRALYAAQQRMGR
jgi:lambda family phage tail tape measure protein